ncbi:serine hydrolase domain-containing protein [Kitasatospora gansuensis]
MAELVGAPDGPPGAIAVLRVDGRTETYSAGIAELGRPERPQPDDHMRLASVSKAYSGAVALALVDCGLLSLDDTIAQRLPELPSHWGAVTLRDLLGHTSGLPDYPSAPAFQELLAADPHREFDSRKLLDFVADRPLQFQPGTTYRYVNSDNIAVALMAEAASGQRYEDLLQSSVFEPLGLHATSLPQGYALPEPYLHGYAGPPPGSPEQPEDVSTALGMSGLWAAGGMVSTPRELATFAGAYAGGRLISPETHEQQLSFRDGASQPSGPGRNEAGLAVFRYTTRCGVVYGHTGNFLGYTQLAVGTPDGRRSLSFSVTKQLGDTITPELVAQLRAVQEDFVCKLLED